MDGVEAKKDVFFRETMYYLSKMCKRRRCCSIGAFSKTCMFRIPPTKSGPKAFRPKERNRCVVVVLVVPPVTVPAGLLDITCPRSSSFSSSFSRESWSGLEKKTLYQKTS